MEYPIHGIIIFSAAFIAATISGAAGFGGAMLLLPVLTFLFGLERALPLLAASQLVGNGARALFGWRLIDVKSVIFFSLGAVPAGLGATLFLTWVPFWLAKPAVLMLVCGAALLEVITVFGKLPPFMNRFKPPESAGLWLFPAGALVGVASGIAGTTGPLPNAFFLRLRLLPAAYIASEAAAMGSLHAAKMIAFGAVSWLRMSDITLLALLSAAMLFGTWCGKKLALQISTERYRSVVAVWMLVASILMYILPTD